MTILLKKDGRLIIDADQPLEGVSLDNLAAILSGANDGDVIQYDATKGMWVNKSAPSSLPEVTASDKGKYLKANESTGDPEWAPDGSDLPDDPAQDGTYNLQNTVSSGTGTLSWASGGSSGGVLVVNQTWNDDWTTATLDKTWQEIHDADVVIVRDASDEPTVMWFPVVSAYEVVGEKPYGVSAWDFSNEQAQTYYASSASGYPSYTA